jgi:hypothetical protein
MRHKRLHIDTFLKLAALQLTLVILVVLCAPLEIAAAENRELTEEVAAELFRAFHKIESMQDNGCWKDYHEPKDGLTVDPEYLAQNGFSQSEKDLLWHTYNSRYPKDFGDYTDGTMRFYSYSDAEWEAIRTFYKDNMTAEFYEPRLEFIDSVTARVHELNYTTCMAHQFDYILKERPDTYGNVRILSNDGGSAVIAADFDMGVDSLLYETHEIRLMLTYEADNANGNAEDGNGPGCWKICGMDWSSVILDAQAPDGRDELSEELIRNAVRALVDDVYIMFSSYDPLDDIPLQRYQEPKRIEAGGVKYLRAYYGLEDRSVFETFLADFCSDEVASLLLAGQNAIEHDGDLYFREYAPCRVCDIYRSISSFNYTVRDGKNADEKLVVFNLLTESTQKQFSEFGSENALLTFVFTKTEEGWKVTGGDFIDRLDAIFETGHIPQPSTGDDSTTLIILALIILLACISLSFSRKYDKKPFD